MGEGGFAGEDLVWSRLAAEGQMDVSAGVVREEVFGIELEEMPVFNKGGLVASAGEVDGGESTMDGGARVCTTEFNEDIGGALQFTEAPVASRYVQCGLTVFRVQPLGVGVRADGGPQEWFSVHGVEGLLFECLTPRDGVGRCVGCGGGVVLGRRAIASFDTVVGERALHLIGVSGRCFLASRSQDGGQDEREGHQTARRVV